MDNQDDMDSLCSASFSKDKLSESSYSLDQRPQERKLHKKKEDQSPHHSSNSDDQDYGWQQERNKLKTCSYRLPQEFQVVVDGQKENKQTVNSEKYTCSTLTKFEKASVLGMRAKQIQQHSSIYIDLRQQDRNKMTAIQIAERELLERKIPFKIRRYLPNNGYEEWELNDFDLE